MEVWRVATRVRVALSALAGMGFAFAAPASSCDAPGRAPYAERAFFGYACPADCSEHKAGFAWAERRGLANAEACDLRPPARAQGCRIYTEFTVTAEQAGFEWARENEVTDPCDCGGAGEAFRAGCEAYLRVVTD